MTKQKDLKRVVRSRMAKTGESYTAARKIVLDRKAPKHPPLPDNYVELAGMSDDAVRAKTGRTWPEWVALLDGIGAATKAHRDVARWIHEEGHAGDWWAQTVTVGYERIRGLRAIGQRRSGSWEANRSRTFPVQLDRLFRAFADAKTRAKWLPDKVTVRKATDGRSARFSFEDGTLVALWFVDKGEKSAVQIQHQKLASKEDADAIKAWWSERLDALARLL